MDVWGLGMDRRPLQGLQRPLKLCIGWGRHCGRTDGVLGADFQSSPRTFLAVIVSSWGVEAVALIRAGKLQWDEGSRCLWPSNICCSRFSQIRYHQKHIKGRRGEKGQEGAKWQRAATMEMLMEEGWKIWDRGVKRTYSAHMKERKAFSRWGRRSEQDGWPDR